MNGLLLITGQTGRGGRRSNRTVRSQTTVKSAHGPAAGAHCADLLRLLGFEFGLFNDDRSSTEPAIVIQLEYHHSLTSSWQPQELTIRADTEMARIFPKTALPR